jgi:hypothetical protein
LLHRVLQLLAFHVVDHLIDRRLPNIQQSFSPNVMAFNFVTHDRPPRFEGRDGFSNTGAATATEVGLLFAAPRRAVSSTWVSLQLAETVPVGMILDLVPFASAPPLKR